MSDVEFEEYVGLVMLDMLERREDDDGLFIYWVYFV